MRQGQATRPELLQLRQRYAIKREDLKPGASVQVFAYNRYAYSAIVIDVERRRACVEFRKNVSRGFTYRRFLFAEIFVAGALQQLRGERAAAPAAPAQEVP